MKVSQRTYSKKEGWSDETVDATKKIVLTFASPTVIQDNKNYDKLRSFYPKADIVLVSTAGEIYDAEVNDDTLSVSAMEFDNTPIKCISQEVSDVTESYKVAESMAEEINTKGLKYVLVFIDGLGINGGHFLEGMKNVLSPEVGITGGLAGDGFDPHNTHVSLNQGVTEKNMAVLVGFYGDSIKIGNASLAGFETFGVERVVTKSEENIVYELDNEPMLELYKKYLGNQAKYLPGAGVKFPLSISKQGEEDWLLRSILTIDEDAGSITFSGNVPQGYRAFLMKTNFDKLVQEAGKAAAAALEKNQNPDFALLISCAGRRIILDQRVEDEVDVIREEIGDNCLIGGFYSYGEIGISTGDLGYELHNETMTVALFSEE